MPDPVKIDHTQKLDEVLVAMDVVDTLRHREQALLKEMDTVGREAQLIDRLREIYKAQGIDVPDEVIAEGVKALGEKRFQYVPPKPSWSVWFAKIYINRRRWFWPLITAGSIVGMGYGAYELGVAGPERAKIQAERVEITSTLPSELAKARDAVLSATEDPQAQRLAAAYYQDGSAALQAQNADGAKAAIAALSTLNSDIAAIYDVRVVFGPNEPQSGIYRLNEDAAGVTNYYLIVEAVSPTGSVMAVPITDSETGETVRVTRWGQRVAKSAFERVAEDKRDDFIIQNSLIGQKSPGQFSADLSVPSPGGAIVEW